MKSYWTNLFPIGNTYMDSSTAHQKWHVVFLNRVQIQTLKHKLHYYLTCKIQENILPLFFFSFRKEHTFCYYQLVYGSTICLEVIGDYQDTWVDQRNLDVEQFCLVNKTSYERTWCSSMCHVKQYWLYIFMHVHGTLNLAILSSIDKLLFYLIFCETKPMKVKPGCVNYGI